MARVTPVEFQEKHARRLKAAVPDIQRGVDRITDNPCEAAARKQDKMLANITDSITNGKWARNLRRVSLSDWKEKMVTKGIPRIATGIDGAAAKTIAFAEDLLPHVDAGVNKVKAMPDLSIEDSINRASTFIRHMADFKRS